MILPSHAEPCHEQMVCQYHESTREATAFPPALINDRLFTYHKIDVDIFTAQGPACTACIPGRPSQPGRTCIACRSVLECNISSCASYTADEDRREFSLSFIDIYAQRIKIISGVFSHSMVSKYIKAVDIMSVYPTGAARH